jgi:uncharacterized protein YprB with RNaseH-like and TPR domain
VREWVAVEKEMRILSRELKERRERKKQLTEQLVGVMRSNDIDGIDVSDGKLVYARRKTKAPISKKHLLASLAQYFQEDDETAAELSQHILDSRDVKIVDTIQKK